MPTSVGLGFKLPTGSISEPNSTSRLPPAFQVGSGAFDRVPSASYFRKVGKGSVFGGINWRIPIEENRRGYEFGQEIELNVGGEYPLSIWNNKVSLLLSASYLDADNDKDTQSVLPAKLRSGTKVLNTGGQFADIAPGFRVKLTRNHTVRPDFQFLYTKTGMATRQQMWAGLHKTLLVR